MWLFVLRLDCNHDKEGEGRASSRGYHLLLYVIALFIIVLTFLWHFVYVHILMHLLLDGANLNGNAYY